MSTNTLQPRVPRSRLGRSGSTAVQERCIETAVVVEWDPHSGGFCCRIRRHVAAVRGGVVFDSGSDPMFQVPKSITCLAVWLPKADLALDDSFVAVRS
jgi:hypothetical protein